LGLFLDGRVGNKGEIGFVSQNFFVGKMEASSEKEETGFGERVSGNGMKPRMNVEERGGVCMAA
jgi:hypothetical protein